jgi:hypothetical protein
MVGLGAPLAYNAQTMGKPIKPRYYLPYVGKEVGTYEVLSNPGPGSRPRCRREEVQTTYKGQKDASKLS